MIITNDVRYPGGFALKYVFDPDVVHKCGLAGLGLKKPEMFDAVAKALETRYPGHIDFTQPWIYSIAGGAMIQMKLYFASVMEYIMIWGTPIGSEGHSGRHHVGFWDTVLDGEAWYYGEGEFERTVYKPGDRIWVGPRQSRGMNFTACGAGAAAAGVCGPAFCGAAAWLATGA